MNEEKTRREPNPLEIDNEEMGKGKRQRAERKGQDKE